MTSSEKTQTQDAAREISLLIPKLIRNIKYSFLVTSSITSSQMISLISIHEDPRCTITQLASALGVSLPTTTGIVDRLHKNGYINRERDEKDRRSVRISLTVKGKKFVENFRSSIQERWYDIILKLDKEEREQYLNILHKVVTIVSAG